MEEQQDKSKADLDEEIIPSKYSDEKTPSREGRDFPSSSCRGFVHRSTKNFEGEFHDIGCYNAHNNIGAKKPIKNKEVSLKEFPSTVKNILGNNDVSAKHKGKKSERNFDTMLSTVSTIPNSSTTTEYLDIAERCTPIKKIRGQYSEYSLSNFQNDVSDWREALNKFKTNISNVSGEQYSVGKSLKSRLHDKKKEMLQNSGEAQLQKRIETEIPVSNTKLKKSPSISESTTNKSHLETLKMKLDKENVEKGIEKSNSNRARVDIKQKSQRISITESGTMRYKYKSHLETLRMKIDKENVKKEIEKSNPKDDFKRKPQRISLKECKDNSEHTNEKEVDKLPEVDTYESFIANIVPFKKISMERRYNRDIEDVGSYECFKDGIRRKKKFKLLGLNSSMFISGNLIIKE